jgi:hypothetical protein
MALLWISQVNVPFHMLHLSFKGTSAWLLVEVPLYVWTLLYNSFINKLRLSIENNHHPLTWHVQPMSIKLHFISPQCLTTWAHVLGCHLSSYQLWMNLQCAIDLYNFSHRSSSMYQKHFHVDDNIILPISFPHSSCHQCNKPPSMGFRVFGWSWWHNEDSPSLSCMSMPKPSCHIVQKKKLMQKVYKNQAI